MVVPARAWAWGAVVIAAIGVLIHVGALWGGPSWFSFFGAPPAVVRSAEAGTWLAPAGTLLIAAAMGLCGLYALSALGRLRRLPLLRAGLAAMATVCLLRALVLIPPGLVASSPAQHFRSDGGTGVGPGGSWPGPVLSPGSQGLTPATVSPARLRWGATVHAMYTCPSCQRQVFTWRDKCRARGTLVCASCGAACWMARKSADGPLVAAVGLAVLSGMTAMALQSRLPWAVGLLAWLLLWAWAVHRRALLPRPPLTAPKPERAGALEASSLLSLIFWWL